jgi:ion channel-forming bestrophin family protein
MYVKKNFNFASIFMFSWFHIVWLTIWAFITAWFYGTFHFEWMNIPWLPLSILGTAVAFYIGFKNNSAYDRLWEARKIWGGIVNSSRMLGSNVRAYVGNQFRDDKLPESELQAIHKKMIYLHIGWLYTLRSQLLVPTPWEHLRNRDGDLAESYYENRKNNFGIGLFDDQDTKNELHQFLPKDEYDKLINHQNSATQILDKQSQELKMLREKNLIDDFRHMELQKLLNDFYTHQGKCERIKKFPLPRQYASMSFVFVSIFIILLPFGLIPAFQELSPQWGHWISMPFMGLIGWIFVMMELIGDYSENPFEGLGNDIPMLSICRTIEIDLLEMLGEEHIPDRIKPVNSTLM